MIIADAHCDTVYRILDEGGWDSSFHINPDKLKKYDGYIQFFACYSDPVYHGGSRERLMRLIDVFHEETASREGISFCRTAKEIETALAEKKAAALLSIEGCEPVESLSDLRNYYRLGVRMASLTWNPENRLATGVGGSDQERGMTAFGKQAALEMNRLGMIVDVSHMNERSFWDLAELSDRPFAASHSNAKSLCGHVRNLTDRQFQCICERKGFVGINLYPLFLSNSKKAGIDDVIRHIEYFMGLGGSDTVGIGADFDGVDALPDGISGPEDLWKIFDRLAQLGYSDDLLEKLSYKNLLSLIRLVAG